MESVYYNGLEFKMYKNGRYYSNLDIKKRLHQYVWETEVGEIPKGYHVHHKDGNKLNNDISNLELLSRKEHLSLHAKKQDKEWLRKNINEKARPKAIEWHKSEKGREWHKEHYNNMKGKLHVIRKFVCVQCGSEFESSQTESKFCSNKCKAKNRRDSGIDNVKKVCPICENEFVSNKYAKTITCSRSCANKMRKTIKDSLNLQE